MLIKIEIRNKCLIFQTYLANIKYLHIFIKWFLFWNFAVCTLLDAAYDSTLVLNSGNFTVVCDVKYGRFSSWKLRRKPCIILAAVIKLQIIKHFVQINSARKSFLLRIKKCSAFKGCWDGGPCNYSLHWTLDWTLPQTFTLSLNDLMTKSMIGIGSCLPFYWTQVRS